MTRIQETLNELRRAAGVRGSALLTPDGLMVAHTLDAQFREDVVAGLTSFLLMTTHRCLRENSMGSFQQFVLHATHGKAVFVELDTSYLVVLLDQFADLDSSRQEIQGAAQRLRRCGKMS